MRNRKPRPVFLSMALAFITGGSVSNALLRANDAFAQGGENLVAPSETEAEAEFENAVEENAVEENAVEENAVEENAVEENAVEENAASNFVENNAANNNMTDANTTNTANANATNTANANVANTTNTNATNTANANLANTANETSNNQTGNDFSLGNGEDESNDAFDLGEKAAATADGEPSPVPNNASPLATTLPELEAPSEPPVENVSVPEPLPELVPEPPPESVPEPLPESAAPSDRDVPVALPPSPPEASQVLAGMGPGAMGADDLQKAREIASKLKELPLGAAPEEYIVQPGDTLWDISDQFLDDPFWWPKLWSLNENAIKNPNLIYPGMVLLFTPSDGAGGPLLAARDTEALINPVSLESSTLQSNNPLANRWRGSRDGDILDADELPKDEGVLSMGDFQASTAYAFRIPGFMTNEDVDAVGEVLSLASSPSLALVGEVSFASFATNPKEGERFLALRKVEDIVAPNGDNLDYPLYVYVATVGVVHLNASGVVSLLVEAGPTGVSPGDVLVPFRNLYVQVNPGLDTRKSTMRSRVVGVLDDNVWLVGEAQAVFLEKDGAVRVGEEVDLFMPPGGSPLFGEDDDELDRVKVGTARVVEVGNETVTAVILTATREITVGASTYARP